MVFYNLGAAHLFEPDEGRNAERARELLLLDNWAVPHENFLPALDKPIFLYWLIALAFTIFGPGEWSARLPSALAALGCLFLVYRFVRERWGDWVAAWSVLILLTNVQFFLYSRIAIFDMVFTFFTTLAFIEYHKASQTRESGARGRHVALMAGAMALATLVKGPIGVVLPGMVIFFHLLLSREWSFLAWRNLVIGGGIFSAVVGPWAWWTELRDPGYLQYFIWEENVLRFLTPYFQRSQPWYYYFFVVVCGFFPWSPFVPLAIKDSLRKSEMNERLFLLLWIALPFIFFLASNSKLPHYILPIFPPLAILTAKTMQSIAENAASKRRWVLCLPWFTLFTVIAYLTIGVHWQSLLPPDIRETIEQTSPARLIYNIVLLLVFVALGVSAVKNIWQEQGGIYFGHCVGTALLLIFLGHSFAVASHTRSAKTLAERARPFLQSQSRLVSYDGYLNGLPFYLQIDRPIWVIWSGRSRIIMQNIYVAQKQPAPAPGFGPVLLTFDEFAKQWKEAKQPLLVFLKPQRIPRLRDQTGDSPKELIRVGDYSLVTNR